jgi:hypothetical protein
VKCFSIYQSTKSFRVSTTSEDESLEGLTKNNLEQWGHKIITNFINNFYNCTPTTRNNRYVWVGGHDSNSNSFQERQRKEKLHQLNKSTYKNLDFFCVGFMGVVEDIVCQDLCPIKNHPSFFYAMDQGAPIPT